MGGRIGANGARRDHLETAMAALVGLLVTMDEVILRMEQAMRRSEVVADVLRPGVRRLHQAREDLDWLRQEIAVEVLGE